jgi:hypothetical protein
MVCHAGLFTLVRLPSRFLHQEQLNMMDFIQNNFWLYMGILVLVLVGLVAVLFVVRKNQDD